MKLFLRVFFFKKKKGIKKLISEEFQIPFACYIKKKIRDFLNLNYKYIQIYKFPLEGNYFV